jgi:hypothetical protein
LPPAIIVEMQTSIAASQLARELTDEEVATYRHNGWVKVERLISVELAADLLAVARERMETAPRSDGPIPLLERGTSKRSGGVVVDARTWEGYHFIARDDRLEPFSSLVYSRAMGRAVQRLIDRDVPGRYPDQPRWASNFPIVYL